MSENKIKDSGERRTFDTGAQRDSGSDKGRFDLLPANTLMFLYGGSLPLDYAIWELAVHFGNGAEKYEPRNWEKGIPISTYFNSACRHAIKAEHDWDDEPHEVATVWNLLCMIWTMQQIEEANLPIDLWDLPHEQRVLSLQKCHETRVTGNTSVLQHLLKFLDTGDNIHLYAAFQKAMGSLYLVSVDKYEGEKENGS